MDENMENTPVERKKRARRKWTEEEKQAFSQKRAEARTMAENMRPVVYMQYQDAETDVDTLVEAAKADFHSTKKRTPVTEMQLYIKPEERAAYYVVNGTFSGKVTF